MEEQCLECGRKLRVSALRQHMQTCGGGSRKGKRARRESSSNESDVSAKLDLWFWSAVCVLF